MKPQKKFFSELNDKSGPYTVKVKVIDKTRKQTSPRAAYQKITLEDERGGRMRATLFNDDIDAYEDVIQTQSIYEITNAAVKPVNEQYLQSEDDLKFQLNFNNRTVIQKIGVAEEAEAEPHHTIDSLPRVFNNEERYDILVVPIFMEATRTVKGARNDDIPVRELVVMDSSTERPLVISAWSDFATDTCEKIEAKIPNYPVIVLTQLKPTHYKGYTLATTPSTLLKIAPEGPKADKLRTWVNANLALLAAKQQHIQIARDPEIGATKVTFAELRNKKSKDVLLEERFAIDVTVPRLDLNDCRTFLGCSHCGRTSTRAPDAIYDCEICKRKDVKSIPRMSCSFEAADQTGSMTFQAYNDEASSLLGIMVDDLYKMSQDAQIQFFMKARVELTTAKIRITIGPTTSLVTSNALKWLLKKVSRLD